MQRRDFITTAALATLGLTTAVRPAAAAPKAEAWEVWAAHDPNATARIDHTTFQRFLGRYVTAREGAANLVDYGQVHAADRERLDRYLEQLSKVRISDFHRDQQMAFWINLYNAVTLEVVLRHYPVESIKDIDISPGLFAQGPWGKELTEVEGRALSLDDIEHRILRPLWGDARIHYAVNCAALGCPDLQKAVFHAALLDDQLDQAARDYVNDPRGVGVTGKELVLSSLYDWYDVDFGADEAEVLDHLATYAGPALKPKLAGAEVAAYRYDWGLNDASGQNAVKASDSGRQRSGSFGR